MCKQELAMMEERAGNVEAARKLLKAAVAAQPDLASAYLVNVYGRLSMH